MILLAAAGKNDEQIAQEFGISGKKSGRWRIRFIEKGRVGIEQDEPGRGRKPTYRVELRERMWRRPLAQCFVTRAMEPHLHGQGDGD